MRRLFAILVLLAGVLAGMPAYAVLPDEVLSDGTLEARARALSTELRCMVCQNQSIDDSDADLARDLRVLIRERLVEGDSDAQVIDYLVARYGEYVLLKPRFNWHTLLLWAAPGAVLVIGAIVIAATWSRRKRGGEPELDAEEREKLAALGVGQSRPSSGRS